MTPANLLTQWSRLLLASLADAGVRDVVLSPGSRSTPFMVAAATEPRLRCHDSIDERAGGFFALGQARITGRPSVVICTSGTAAAHYLPAVVEANLDHLPLLVLTADRPLELQDCGAPQTIDQVKLMGDHVRRFYELGTPDPAPSALAGLRRLAAQAVHLSGYPVPGPVHLNARARKPLEPTGAVTDDERDLETRVDQLLSRPIVRAHPPLGCPDPAVIEDIARRCRAAERGLIVAGPAPLANAAAGPAVVALARRTGYPLLAEATSQIRFGPAAAGVVRCDGFDAVLRSAAFRAHHRPELVIQVNAAPVSTGFERYSAAHVGVDRVVFTAYSWMDPDSTATDLVFGDPVVGLEALVGALDGFQRGATGWSESFAAADRRVWEVVDELLARGDKLNEGDVLHTVVNQLPAESLLMLGNSLPVREADTFCRRQTGDIGVLCQRGANGIDGLVAGAAGSASVEPRPVTLVLGDVSLLHDLNGLALAAQTGQGPLVVVVVNNRGGRIFETLPLATAGVGPEVMDHVLTPHAAAFEHAAALFGHRFALVASVDELGRALEQAYASAGCTVIEADVPDHGAAELQAALFAGVDAAVGDLSVD